MTFPARGLFVSGTSTEVGKTYVAAMIARALAAAGRTVGAYKPVASGCRPRNNDLVADDALLLWEATGRLGTLDDVCPQRFRAPLAPHRAAAAEQKRVDAALLRSGLSRWSDRCEIVVVEGAGGLMSPISDDDYVADLAAEFGYPLIVVAANELGVINQTLQTLITAVTYSISIEVAGVVLNDTRPADEADESRGTNYQELVDRCGPPVLAHVAHGAVQFPREIDWSSLAGG